MWSELLGSVLQSKDGVQDTTECLNDAEYVLLYVSAHWCGPCRAMTPRIAEAYRMQTGHARVVFVSLDNSQGQFDEYFQTMPWHAVPYDEDRHDIVNKLSDLARTPIKSIPALIVLDKVGKVVTVDGCRTFETYFQAKTEE